MPLTRMLKKCRQRLEKEASLGTGHFTCDAVSSMQLVYKHIFCYNGMSIISRSCRPECWAVTAPQTGSAWSIKISVLDIKQSLICTSNNILYMDVYCSIDYGSIVLWRDVEAAKDFFTIYVCALTSQNWWTHHRRKYIRKIDQIKFSLMDDPHLFQPL